MSEVVPTVRARVRSWFTDAKANPRFRWGLLGASVLMLIDQASKFFMVEIVRLPERWQPCVNDPSEMCRQISVSPVFNFTYVENTGASFGMLAGGMFSRVLLSGVAIGISVWLIIWLGRLERRWAAFGAAFIIGGALGNLIDRVRLGYVVDFFDFSGLYFPFVFNVADIFIDIGIGFLLLDAFLTRDKAPKSPKI